MNIRLLFLPILALIPITNYPMMDKIKYYANPYTYIDSYYDQKYQDASPELQEWGKIVQENVGIKHPVRIKIMSENEKKQLGGYVSGQSIFINDDVFDNTSIPYGVKNHILYHEAIHFVEDHYSKRSKVIKMYSGAYCIEMGWLGALLYNLHCSPFMELNSHAISASSLLVVASIASDYFITNEMNFAQESAADIKGAYAMGCYCCAYESSSSKDEIAADYTSLGYASAKKIRAIAKELREQKKICEHHKKNLK